MSASAAKSKFSARFRTLEDRVGRSHQIIPSVCCGRRNSKFQSGINAYALIVTMFSLEA